MRNGLAVAALGLLVASAGACGGGDGHPDTGYGAAQPVPVTENCTDLCNRTADCAAHLCAEDTGNPGYVTVIPQLATTCQSACTDAAVSSGLPPAAWSCLFMDTCRQVLGHNACAVSNTTYTCQ